jgi:hypothetical protein
MTHTFQQMANNRKVEVGLEAKTHQVIKLLEMPFQWFTSLHHNLLQTLVLKQRHTVQHV